ncbi:MAG TPA: NCS2 family permease [Terriglobia bacterium]|nr:NCS2 family permease [Terriglobia bacterium]
MKTWISRYFQIEANGTTLQREVVGGTTTFLAMSYIIFVQPGVLSQAGMDFQAVLCASCLAAALSTFLMGLIANYPVALAPGMGENFFFVYTLCAAAPLGFGLTWQQALGAVLLAGIFFIAITLTGIRAKIVNSIPDSLKRGIAAGIGLFIAFIGLEYGGLVVGSPGTLVRLGDFSQPSTLASVLGLLVLVVLLGFGVRGAILMGILATTAIAAAFGLIHFHGIFSTRIYLAATFLKFDLRGLFAIAPSTLGAAIFVLFYLALFDTVGTLVGVGQQAGLVKEGKLPRAGQALFADAVGTTVGAALGTSTITCYIESAAGVSDGARTGLANMVTGILLLAAMFFSPLAAMIGGGVKAGTAGGSAMLYPTLAPALIVVGSMMLKVVREFNWDDPTEYLPAFLVLVGIPLTFSIADGIAFGLIAYCVAKVATGRWRECPALTYIFAALFVVQFLVI